jgi:hypothetical protein
VPSGHGFIDYFAQFFPDFAAIKHVGHSHGVAAADTLQ